MVVGSGSLALVTITLVETVDYSSSIGSGLPTRGKIAHIAEGLLYFSRLAEYSGVSKGVATGLGINGESVWFESHFDFGQELAVA